MRYPVWGVLEISQVTEHRTRNLLPALRLPGWVMEGKSLGLSKLGLFLRRIRGLDELHKLFWL